MVQAKVTAQGNFSEVCLPPEPCRESFSVHDQIHESLAPLTSAGTGSATLIDAVFAGRGTLVDTLQPGPTVPTAPQNSPLVLAGGFQLAGQLQETITPPPSNSTSAPTTQSLTVDLTANGLFNEVSGMP
jgi:hypothetical protein